MEGLTYRHWFFISILVLVNVIIFGCVILVLAEKMVF
jgi:hypothetical protein